MDELQNKLAEYIDGGVATWYFDAEWFQEMGFCSADFFGDNETEIAYMFDDYFFSCNFCGWTMPNDCMGEDLHGELRCTDCENEPD